MLAHLRNFALGFSTNNKNYEHRNNRNWNIPWNMEEKKMTGWKVTGEKATVKGEVVEAKTPLHKNTPHAMQLNIKKMQQGGKAVLTNTGYWGIGLKAGRPCQQPLGQDARRGRTPEAPPL